MALIIITKYPGFDFKEGFKNFIKEKIKRVRGPQAVTASLLRGLEELKINYLYNPPNKNIGAQDIVWVNNSLKALQWAIAEKKKNKFLKLVAGPALVILPTEANNIIRSPEIDIILVPADWVKNLYIAVAPEIAEKIRVWPSGVNLPTEKDLQNKKNKIIIYLKNPSDKNLLAPIINRLTELKIKFKIFRYGHFKQADYYAALNGAKAVIYLSDSESQGLALLEAWARNVPTLAWSRGYWQFDKIKFQEDKISCPYLNESTGIIFKNQDDFFEKFNYFYNNLNNFQAREYVKKNFTDKICAEKFLDIINSLL
jgi:glycosyltransferase involved in cell wall biosynthesis